MCFLIFAVKYCREKESADRTRMSLTRIRVDPDNAKPTQKGGRGSLWGRSHVTALRHSEFYNRKSKMQRWGVKFRSLAVYSARNLTSITSPHSAPDRFSASLSRPFNVSVIELNFKPLSIASPAPRSSLTYYASTLSPFLLSVSFFSFFFWYCF